jgi:hypothetical protein
LALAVRADAQCLHHSNAVNLVDAGDLECALTHHGHKPAPLGRGRLPNQPQLVPGQPQEVGQVTVGHGQNGIRRGKALPHVLIKPLEAQARQDSSNRLTRLIAQGIGERQKALSSAFTIAADYKGAGLHGSAHVGPCHPPHIDRPSAGANDLTVSIGYAYLDLAGVLAPEAHQKVSTGLRGS